MIATASVCMILTTLILALRMFTKAVVIKSTDWGDCKLHVSIVLPMGILMTSR